MIHPLLIDGHNAIHRLRLGRGTIHVLRTRLVNRVRLIAPRGAIVFFDGHPPTGEFGGTEIHGVTVRYSGGCEADEAIVEHLHDTKHPRRCTVVTDDLGLARRAEKTGASSMRVVQFFVDAPDVAEPEKPLTCGLRAADFGLPETVDLDTPVRPDERVPPRPGVRRRSRVLRVPPPGPTPRARGRLP